MVYRPDTGKVRLRPIGFLKPFTLSLDPANRLIRSPGGHRVDQSDLGFLLRQAQQLNEAGQCRLREQDSRTALLEVFGPEGVVVGGVSRYLLWLSLENKLPLRVEAYDRDNRLIEGLWLDNLAIDPEFGDVFEL